MPNGQIMTVLGPVAAESLGQTLIHEHVLFDLSVYHRALKARGETSLPDGPIGIEHLHILRHNVPASSDNVVQKSVDVAADELRMFKDHGGGSVVEVTSVGLEPEPGKLADLSRKTGVQIVVGTGYYIGLSHPAELADMSVARMEAAMLRDFVDGFAGTDVKAGVIGEMGSSEPLTATEDKALRAAARVQKRTGAALVLHPDSNHRTYEPIARTLGLLESEGARLDKVVISHCDERLHQSYADYARLAKLGCVLAFDTFGKQHYYPARGRQYPNDERRVELIARLVVDGLAGSLALAHDVCYKTDLARWGGDGYGHIPRNIVPRLKLAGVSEAAIEQMLVLNPRRVLPLTP